MPLLQVYSMGYKGRLGIMRDIVNLWYEEIVDDINTITYLISIQSCSQSF